MMPRTGNKLAAIFLALVMAVTVMPFTDTLNVVAAEESAEEPAAIQDTYELDGVTYFDVGSDNFAGDQIKFFKDMLGSRSNVIRQRGEWDAEEYEYKYYDQSEADLWLQTGVSLLTDLEPDGISNEYDCIRGMFNAAVRGSDFYDDQNGMTYQARRFDVEGKTSPKAAEDWVFQKTFGADKNFGYYKDDSSEQLTLATAVNVKEQYNSRETNSYTVAAYFSNFRISALIPSDEGTNYVTELITDTVNARSTTASTVKNLTASTVTGSQSLSNSISASVSNSLSGSESYSKSTSKKVGASYKFTEAFQVSGEYSWTEGEAFSTGWGSSDSVSKSKNSSYSVSVPLAPYTQVMITQSDTTSVYLTRYNCPIALLYDVTIVGYQTGQLGDRILHTGNTNIYVDGEWIPIDRDAVYSFSDPLNGARGDLETRINACENWNDMDRQGLRWRMILEKSKEDYDLSTLPDVVAATQRYVPMSSVGGAYTQTLNVVATEVTGLMPTHPLYRVKIADPGVDIHTDEVSYQLFDYFTAKMKVGDFSYANYMNLIGLNRYDVPFYGFSKDNGYWIITDKEGNELDPADSPVLLEKDPVTTNWRYTAVKPGTCYMVYRIDEDAYYIAERPDDPIKNEDLVKTAALEIIVTEKDFTGTIEISGSYQGNINVDPDPLEGEDKLSVAVYDETGKEIEKDYTWEAREMTGIILTGDMVSFTKPGTYHVRACSDDIRSEWYEIKAIDPADPGSVIPEEGHEHKMTRTRRKAATCTETGNIEYYSCSECGGIFRDEAGKEELSEGDLTLPALGHNWTEWETEKDPTEHEEGQQTRFCRNDTSHKQTRSVPVLAHKHTLKKIARKAPTCTTAGNIMYYTCSGCSGVFTDYAGNQEISPEETVLPATGHKWDGGRVTKKATATTDGILTYTCSVCGADKTAPFVPTVIPAEISPSNPVSAASVDKQIKNAKTDDSPKGSVFSLLQARGAAKNQTSLKVSWKKISGATAYVIYGNKCGAKHKYKKIKTVTGTSFTHKNLKKGTYYKYLIVAVNGEKALATSKTIHVATKGGKVGNHKSVKTKAKKDKVTLKAGKTFKLQAKAVAQNKKLKVNKHRAITYESSEKTVAAVSNKGVIKAIKKGSCYVYAYAQNGVCRKIKVTVK